MTASSGAEVAACCSALYGSPLAELLVGESFHPGGARSTRELVASAGLGPGDRLLDVGCGLGASARLAAGEFGLCVDAVDASPAVIERARARGDDARVRLAVSALPGLAFDDASFDGVLAECVLSTVDRSTAIPELRRVLRPGGAFLLSDVEVDGDPIPELGHRLIGAALCVSDAWRPGELNERLGSTGLRIVSRSDRSDSIIDLVDRIEARLGIMRLAARDLGLDAAALLGTSAGPDAIGGIEPEEARDAAAAIRSAVAAGSLRYVAVTAQAPR